MSEHARPEPSLLPIRPTLQTTQQAVPQQPGTRDQLNRQRIWSTEDSVRKRFDRRSPADLAGRLLCDGRRPAR